MRSNDTMANHASTWVFGYGSLIWKPGFPYVDRRFGRVRGWKRRFWQGSPDHRGTEERPGRVVTLVREPAASTWGAAYLLSPETAEHVFDALDVREAGGYERHGVAVLPDDGGVPIDATVYVATPQNPHYLGPAPLEEMARHIARSHGPSGPNDEYLLELDDSLRGHGVVDGHVRALARAVRAYGSA